MYLLHLDSPLFSGGLKLLVSFFKDVFILAVQFVRRSDVADGTVEADGVVTRDVLCHKMPGLVKRKRRLRTDAFSLERLVKPFQLAVRLRIVGRGSHMRHASDANKLFEVTRDKLRAVVGDDSRPRIGELLACPLKNHLDVNFLHLLPYFPVNDRTTAAIQDAAHEVKRPADIQIADIDVPVFMRLEGLLKAGSFLRGLTVESIHHAGFAKNAVNRRGTDSHDASIQHHERQPPVAFQGMAAVEVQDRFLLPIFEPEISRDRTVVFVDFAVAFLPVEELAATDAQPSHDLLSGDFASLIPVIDVINDLITSVVGNPASC
jgi:hypothetical protein